MREWRRAAQSHVRFETMNTVVRVRCDFDPTFPDLKSLPKGQDRIPGRPLAELVVSGLRKRGFNASDVINEEPFFVTRCRSGEYEYQILSFLTYPDPAGPVWEVSCAPTIGFWGKLFGKSEDKELGPLLDAIHDTLKSDSHIKEMRWFPESSVSSDPFAEKKYATSPRSEI